MIDFKKNISEIGPYNRNHYIEFLDYNYDLPVKWYGVSFQLPGGSEGKHIELSEFVKIYEDLFKKVVLKLDNGSFWIVNHDDKDLVWFPNEVNNLIQLRTLFKERNVSNAFKGALIFTTGTLLEYSKDLISYPFSVLHKDGFLYKNLDISHAKLQFIIKISGHLNIDFLSTKPELLRGIVSENSSGTFIIKKYKGSSLV